VSLTISAAQVDALISDPTSFSGYSSSGPIIITGNITHTQANNLNSVGATYIQATVTETTVANLGTISVDNTSRTVLNKFTFTVSDTAATAAELNTAQAKTSVAVDASNVANIEASPASDLTTLYTGTTPSGIDDADIAVNDTTISASDYNAIDGYTSGTATFAATTIEGAVADISTALSGADANVIHESDIAVTVTDTTVSASDLDTVEGLTTGLVTVSSNATSISGTITDVGNSYGHNDAGTPTITGLDDLNITLVDDGTTAPTAADVVTAIGLTTGKVTATVDTTQVNVGNFSALSGTGHAITIAPLQDATMSAAELKALDAVTTETITFAAGGVADAGPTISTSSYTDALDVFSSAGINGLGSSAVTVSGTITVAEANALNAKTDGAITAAISSTDIATLLTLDANSGTTGNSYTFSIADASVTAANLNTLAGLTAAGGGVTSSATTVTGSASDVNDVYVTNIAKFTGIANEDVTITDTALDAALLDAIDTANSGTIDLSAATSISGTAAHVSAAFTKSAAGSAMTGLPTDTPATITDTTLSAETLMTIAGTTAGGSGGQTTGLVTVSGATSISGNYTDVHDAFTANTPDASTTTAHITGLNNVAVTITDDGQKGIASFTVAGTSGSGTAATSAALTPVDGTGVTGTGITVKITDDGNDANDSYTIGEITTNGSGYAVGDTFTILGTSLGGLSPANDLTLTVATLTANPLTLAEYNDIANNYTTGVITATLESDELGDLIDSSTGLASGNTANVTISDTTINAEDLVALANSTSGTITVDGTSGSAINGTLADAVAIFSNSSITASGIADSTVTLDAINTAAASDLLTITSSFTGGATGDLDIANVGRISGTITDVNAVFSHATVNNGGTQNVTITDATVDAVKLATLIGDVENNNNLTTGNVDILSSAINGSVAEVATIIDTLNNNGDAAEFNASTSDGTVTGLSSINVTLDNGAEAVADIEALAALTTGIITGSISETSLSTVTGALTETDGHVLDVSIAGTDLSASDLVTLQTLTAGNITLTGTSPTITGNQSNVSAVLGSTRVTGFSSSNVVVTGGLTVSQLNDITDVTSGTVSALITDGDMATLSGITAASNNLTITVTDASVVATELTALDAKTTGQLNVSSSNDITGTYTEVDAVLDATTITGRGGVTATLSDTSISVANANLIAAKTTGAITATITETDLNTLTTAGGGAGIVDGGNVNNYAITVAVQRAASTGVTVIETIEAANLNTLDSLTNGVITVTAPTISGVYADVTDAFTANTAGNISGLETKDVIIDDATGITQAEAELAQAFSSGVLTATIADRDATSVDVSSLTDAADVNVIGAGTNVTVLSAGTGFSIAGAGDGLNGAVETYTTASSGGTGTVITNASATSGNGAEATFNVSVATDGVYTVSILGNGKNFVNGETITIKGSDLGGSDGAPGTGNDLVITVTGSALTNTRTAGSYTVEQLSTAGTGTGAAYVVTVEADGSVSDVTVSGGGGYTADEVVTISGAVIGGTATTGNFTIPVDAVGANSIANFIAQTTAGTYDIESGNALSITFDDDSIDAADLVAANSLTSGLITLVASTSGGDPALSGTLSDLNAVFAAAVASGDGILNTSLDASLITIQEPETFGGLISAADLLTLDAAAGGVITVDADWDADTDATTGVGTASTTGLGNAGDEQTITGITGTYSDVHDVLTAAKTQANTTDATGAGTPSLSIPDNLTVTLTGSSTVAQVNDIAGYNVGAVTATLSDTDMATLDGLFGATTSVDDVDTLSASAAADNGRTNGTYTNVTTTSAGSGSGLTLDITVAGTAVTLSNISVANAGVGYADDEVITIDGAKLGGGADITIAVNGLVASTVNAYTVTVDDTSVAATNLNNLDDKTSVAITLNSTTLTGALAASGDVDTALSSNGITDITSIAVTSDDATNTVTEVNNISSQTTGVVTATLADGLLSTFGSINETGNAYTITITDTGSIDAATVNVLNGKTTGVIDLTTATTVTGALSDIKALYDAPLTEVTGLGNEAITISDTGTVSSSDLNDLNELTTGVVSIASATTVSGTLSELVDSYSSSNIAGVITGLSNEAVTVTDTGSVSAADLVTLDGETSGVVTVSSATGITGSYSDINSVYSSAGITGLDAAAITVNASVTVAEANALDLLTSGVITANISTDNIDSLDSLTGTGNAYTITVADTSVSASNLSALDAKTTVDVTVSSSTIKGNASELIAAYGSDGIDGLGTEDISYEQPGAVLSGSVGIINTINGLTTGTVTGTVADGDMATLAGITESGNALSITVTDTSASATALTALDAKTTVAVDASAVTTLTGTETEQLAAYAAQRDGTITGLDNAFDAASYLASHSDLLGTYTTASVKSYFFDFGIAEGRALDTFDEATYLASYTDLLAYYGTDTSSVTSHYVTFGYGEGRSTDAFDELGYIASHADLIEYIGVDATTAVTHYINFGYGEGRSVTFDAESYLDANADLKAFIQDDLELAKKHYILHGADEGRLLA